MRPLTRGITSGCLIWLILSCFLAICLCPAAIILGVFSSTLGAESVARTLEPYLCPEHSRAEIVTFETTTRDEFGNESPATGYQLQCVDEGGDVVKEASADYAFYWTGILVAGGLGTAAILAMLVSLPMAILIAHYAWRSGGVKVPPVSAPPGRASSPSAPTDTVDPPAPNQPLD